MQIRFHSDFEKRFKKLSPKMKQKVKNVLAIFIVDPLSPALKNHALRGNLRDKRAISVTGDCRIIFEEFETYALVVFLDVGSHNQVY